MAVALALAAALFFAVGTVLQQKAAAGASDEQARRAGFLLRLARQPLWLAGIAVDGLGFVCQAAALGVGRLVVVQPLLAVTIVFALPLGAAIAGQRIESRQMAGALAVTGGLAVFLVVSEPSGGRDDAPLGDWLPAGAILAAVTVALFAAGARRGPGPKAALYGLAAGILFGVSAALTKATVDDLGDGILAVLSDWNVYALIVVGYASMSLSAAPLQTGELAPAVATSMTLDPVTSVALGVTMFQESLHDSAAGAAASLVALGAMVAGIVVLAAAQRPPAKEPVTA
jgi:drug/metabolite transporter (DMT)-like permease